MAAAERVAAAKAEVAMEAAGWMVVETALEVRAAMFVELERRAAALAVRAAAELETTAEEPGTMDVCCSSIRRIESCAQSCSSRRYQTAPEMTMNARSGP